MSKLDFREKVKSYSEPYQREDWLRMQQLLHEDSSNQKQNLLWFWKSSFLIFALFAAMLSISWINQSNAPHNVTDQYATVNTKIHTEEDHKIDRTLESDKNFDTQDQQDSETIEISIKKEPTAIEELEVIEKLDINEDLKVTPFNSKTTSRTIASNIQVNNNQNKNIVLQENNVINHSDGHVLSISEHVAHTPILDTENMHTDAPIHDFLTIETLNQNSSIPNTFSRSQLSAMSTQVLQDYLEDINGIKITRLASISTVEHRSPVLPVTDIIGITKNKIKSYINISTSIKFPSIQINEQDFGNFKSSQSWAASYSGEIGYIVKPVEIIGIEAGIEAGILQFRTGKEILISDHSGNPLPINAHITERTSFVGPYIRAHYLNKISTKNLLDLSIAYHHNFIQSKDYSNADEECTIGRVNDLRRSDCVLYNGEVIYTLKDTYATNQLGQLEFGANYIHKVSNKNHISIGMNYRLGLNEILNSKYSFLYEYHNENYSIGGFDSKASGLELKLGYWFG